MSELSQKRLIIAVGFLSLTLSLVFSFIAISPETSSSLQLYAEQNPTFLPSLITISHIIGVVIAPSTSFAFTFFSIPYIGWFAVASYSTLGNMIGYVIAFKVATIFRSHFRRLFRKLEEFHDWQTQISKKKEFWGFYFLRIAAQLINDYVSYLAGLTAISFLTFVFASFLYELTIQFPRTYLFSLGFTVHPALFALGALPFLLGYGIYHKRIKRKR